MELSEQSFVIQDWLEITASEAGHGTWRGRITHLPGGERKVVTQIGQIVEFISPYLDQMCAPAACSSDQEVICQA